jgi:MoxR-like ATPase
LHLSDRRIVRTQRLIAAATVLSGRMVATEADVWPLLYVIPTQATQLRAQAVLRELLHLSNNPTLRFAVETAVAQPMSRVDRLKEAAKHALEQPDATAIEQVLRDLDANFMTEQLPEDLKDLRQQLIAMMAQT